MNRLNIHICEYPHSALVKCGVEFYDTYRTSNMVLVYHIEYLLKLNSAVKANRFEINFAGFVKYV